jgi:ribose-phosphate pyrophosphokinase
MHYRRQDHEDYEGEIRRNRWLVEMMKASGISHVIMVTPHSQQTLLNFEDNKIICKCVNLSDLFANRLRPYISQSNKKKAKVYAPDEGSIIRAVELAKRMEIGVLFSLKNRGFNNETTIVEADQQKIEEIKQLFISFPDLEYATPERVKDSIVIMVEDEVDSGGTIHSQAVKLRKNGAKKIYVVFSHAVCTDPWRRKLFGADNPFTQVIVCDTIPRGEDKRTGGKVHDVSVSVPIASELFIMLEEAFGMSDN